WKESCPLILLQIGGISNVALQVGWGSGQEAIPTDFGKVVGRGRGKRVL
nr:hypothetical protein [Tanacetum cinerariifolium]